MTYGNLLSIAMLTVKKNKLNFNCPAFRSIKPFPVISQKIKDRHVEYQDCRSS